METRLKTRRLGDEDETCNGKHNGYRKASNLNE